MSRLPTGVRKFLPRLVVAVRSLTSASRIWWSSARSRCSSDPDLIPTVVEGLTPPRRDRHLAGSAPQFATGREGLATAFAVEEYGGALGGTQPHLAYAMVTGPRDAACADVRQRLELPVAGSSSGEYAFEGDYWAVAEVPGDLPGGEYGRVHALGFRGRHPSSGAGQAILLRFP